MLRQLKSLIRPDPMVRFIRQHVKDGQCAIDIGANVGKISQALLDYVGPTGQVHAFEPNAELVAKHLSQIHAPNFHVHRKAVSSGI